MQRTHDKFFPVAYKSWDMPGEHTYQFNDVIMTAPFGPFMTGVDLNCICFNVETGEWSTYDKDGTETHQGKFKPISW